MRQARMVNPGNHCMARMSRRARDRMAVGWPWLADKLAIRIGLRERLVIGASQQAYSKPDA